MTTAALDLKAHASSARTPGKRLVIERKERKGMRVRSYMLASTPRI